MRTRTPSAPRSIEYGGSSTVSKAPSLTSRRRRRPLETSASRRTVPGSIASVSRTRRESASDSPSISTEATRPSSTVNESMPVAASNRARTDAAGSPRTR